MNALEQPPLIPAESGSNSPQPASEVAEGSPFVAAVQFLTRIPWRTNHPVSPAVLAKSPRYFPLVGGLIGAATTLVAFSGGHLWPTWLAVLVALAAEALLTGAFHEDAVADFCDAFGGGWTRDDVLRILKDSRIGTYGALGLFLAVSLRAGGMLVALENSGAQNVLAWGSIVVAAAALGRWASVLGMVLLPPVQRHEGLARDVGRRLSKGDLALCSLWGAPCVLPFVWQFPVQALLVSVGIGLFVAWFLQIVRRKLGGVTGDCLGCLGYATQVVVLLLSAARFTTGGGS